MEFDETPTFLYPRGALDVWINFSSRTIELRQSKCRENLYFFYFSPLLSLSLSLYLISSPSLLSSSPHFLFFFLSFSPFLIHRTSFLFVCSHLIFSFFSFLLFLLFLSFSLIFLFLPFLFSISHLDCINQMVQKLGKLPPTFLHFHLLSPPFFLLIS